MSSDVLTARSHKAVILMIIGAVMTLGSAVTGFVWLNLAPKLDPVPFGEQSQLTATRSGTATIFSPTGQSAAPPCTATTPDGAEVVLGEPERYLQLEGMESSYGFPTSSGSTYTVTCGDPGQVGRFAVEEVSRFPEAVFLTFGSLGLLACAAGALAWRHRPSTATPGRRLGNWSFGALVAFIPWTAAFMFAVAAYARSRGLDPDQPFGAEVEGVEWLQWAAAAALWELPLMVAAVLGVLGMRRGGGTRAKIGAYLGTALGALLLLQSGLPWLVG